MSYEWSRYDLEDNPFLLRPAINVWALDKRLNGRLFCEEIVSDQMKKLMSLITRELNVVYVNSPLSVLGTGKSAVMAAAHWRLMDKERTVIWVEATGGVSTSPTLGRIVDSMVGQGIFDDMYRVIGEITYDRIRGMLSDFYRNPSPALTQALVKVFRTPPGETAKKFANIRRSILISSAIELFGYLISLMTACGLTRPVIFIDQFEEYVRAHRGSWQLGRLGNDINDLLRAIQNRATLVVSLHPEAEKVLMTAAGSWVRTFAPISVETMVTIEPMTPKDAVKLASFYLSEYRKEGSDKPVIYPFTEDVLKYISLKTNQNPRSFITALHNALVEGALQYYVDIDAKFVSNEDNHSKVLLGASNEWNKFEKGELA